MTGYILDTKKVTSIMYSWVRRLVGKDLKIIYQNMQKAQLRQIRAIRPHNKALQPDSQTATRFGCPLQRSVIRFNYCHKIEESSKRQILKLERRNLD